MTVTYVEEIAASARAVLEREAPLDSMLPRLRGESLSAGAWRAAAEVGWFRLLTSGSAGGLGAGPAELAALFQKIGRHLVSGPFLEDVVAAGLLRDHADLGPDSRVVTFGRLSSVSGTAAALSGQSGYVEHAGQGDLVLLEAVIAGAPAIVAVDPRDPGVILTPVRSVDLVGRPFRLELAGAPVEILLEGDGARDALARIAMLTTIAELAQLAGIGRQVLDISVQYAKDRVQFDRPIGSFQAVQHRLAEMAVTQAAIQSCLEAALAGTASDERWRALHGLAAEMARDLVLSALQVHGGIGFTDEHPLHAYIKRVLRLEARAALSDSLAGLGGRLLAG